MGFLFVVAQVTETRTGPLGCSNYDNLDSVSSVLVQSPENKVQLQGVSDLLFIFFTFIVILMVCFYRSNIPVKSLSGGAKLQ